MNRQISPKTRRLLTALLAIAGCAFVALLVTTYLKTAAPSSFAPNPAELHRLLFAAARPISALERRLAATDTPLGTGPLIVSGTSIESAFRSESLSPTELVQRDGERLALLDWIRSGASRAAYECDDYPLRKTCSIAAITPQFEREVETKHSASARRIRIRSIINERCVNCHHEDGDDTARLIPFDSYNSVAVYLRPETHADTARPWLLATLLSLFPLVALAGVAFSFTSR